MLKIEDIKAQRQRLEAQLDPHFQMSEDYSYVKRQQQLLDTLTQLLLWESDYPRYAAAVQAAKAKQQPVRYSYTMTTTVGKLQDALAAIRLTNGTLTDVQPGLRLTASYTAEDYNKLQEVMRCL